ncbi:SAM-dependent methyltransferase [uncultured Rhodoblastus sp.]|uniref:class I SAM-dependent methyltransferase n=1 Tax=uncultured Rhodoblastus sp. TaxID=543037 RepID=UPI0025EAE6F6|nr:SAM-dependent methyltransferase [uncultured Rhodoblastus sp.]
MTEAHHHTLGAELREIIAIEGPISLERFMELALTHPTLGYYTTRDPFGVDGDFITSPEISQMFGELLGLWAAQVWRQIGAPEIVHLVELGPGRGTLMADALRAAKAAPEFFDAIHVELVEASDIQVEQQRAALAGCGRPVNWRRTVEDVPPGPAIFLANEFFDALPVRHYVNSPEGWRERLVGLDAEGALTFGLSAEVEPYIKVKTEDGSVLEIGAAAQRLVTRIAARIVTENGALLAVDYGYDLTTLGETLQAVKAHDYVDVLAEPGEADITAHVDFSALSRAARAANAKVFGPVGQGDFLIQIGIAQRAEALKAQAEPEVAEQIDLALARLAGAGENEMGELFRVLAVTRRGVEDIPGFAGDDATS